MKECYQIKISNRFATCENWLKVRTSVGLWKHHWGYQNFFGYVKKGKIDELVRKQLDDNILFKNIVTTIYVIL
jgi:hypothetical protein